MPNPFQVAQSDAAQDPSNPGLAQGAPQFQAAQGPMQAQPQFHPGDPIQSPTYNPPSADQIGAIRDSLLSQFPDIMAPERPPAEMDATQKLTLFGLFLANPQGAMDMVRQRRVAEAKRQAMRAQLSLHMTGVAGEILKAQNEAEKAILEGHLAVNRDFRGQKEMEFNEHIQRGQLALQQATFAQHAREIADQHQFNAGLLNQFGMGGGAGAAPAAGATPGAPGVPGAGAGVGGMRRTVSFAGKDARLSFTDPSTAQARDPQVAFESWVRVTFPRGVPSRLDPSKHPGSLFQIYQDELTARNGVKPGTFGGAGVPFGGGNPQLFADPSANSPDPTDPLSINRPY